MISCRCALCWKCESIVTNEVPKLLQLLLNKLVSVANCLCQQIEFIHFTKIGFFEVHFIYCYVMLLLINC